MIWNPRSLLARPFRFAWAIAFCVPFLLAATQDVKADNVLLIIADDLGSDSLGLFSTAMDTAPTPNLDNLAANGVRFTQCWGNPSCAPSRASLLTGRHGFRTGVGNPGDAINLSESTIADAFKDAGYGTACIGKWHLANNQNGGNSNPNMMGFDHYSGALAGGINNYFSWPKVVDGQSQQQSVTTYATTENVNDALSWIGDQQDDWFLWLAFNAPHSPYHLPPNDLHTSNLSGTNADINSNPELYYRASIEAMDTEIGRLLNSMDPAVLAETTVIFIGDNGTPTAVSPETVRGSKGTLWEGGVHVPCIVSGPAVSGSLNRTNDETIMFVDFFKTMLEAAGLDADDHVPDGAATDSVSFAAHLTDENAPSTHAFQFSTRFTNPTNRRDGRAIATDDFKLILYDNGDEEFFDRADEFTNLFDGPLGPARTGVLDELLELMAIVVDPPKVNSIVRDSGSIARPDLIDSIQVVFNQHVSVAAEDLTLQNDTTGQAADLAGIGFTYDATTFTATWDLSVLPTPLEAAFYTSELASTNIASVDDDTELDGDGDGVSGPNPEESLLVAIPGDITLDGTVDVLGDAFALIANLGLSGDTSWSQGDLDADGTVDVLGDAFILIGNLGRTVNP